LILLTQKKTSIESIFILGENITYELVRSKKRKYSLAMKVRGDGVLQLNVPYSASLIDIESFIKNKYQWIQRIKLEKSTQEPKLKLNYKYGEKHYYLGNAYTLQLVTASHTKVESIHQNLVVFHRKNNSIKNILTKWYKKQAFDYFTTRTQQLIQEFNFPAIKCIKLRSMKARWGSCSSDSIITFNTNLIKALSEHIDYVIIHELCHLIHPNHGKGFYRLQSQCNPSWKQQKKQLNKLGYLYLNH